VAASGAEFDSGITDYVGAWLSATGRRLRIAQVAAFDRWKPLASDVER